MVVPGAPLAGSIEMRFADWAVAMVYGYKDKSSKKVIRLKYKRADCLLFTRFLLHIGFWDR
jgi:hypothetical protein